MNNSKDVEIMATPDNTLSLLAKAEIDQQIATAHAFPRSVRKFQDEARALATLDMDTALACIYALPRGGKAIKGPSIRFAEILASSWGNLRIGSRIVKVGATTVTAQGICHDLEKNQAQTAEIERRITNKEGKRFNEDMIAMTCNAAAAIARRNAIMQVIPKALWKQIYEDAMTVSLGNAKTISERRAKAVEYFSKLGIEQQRLLWALGRPSIEQITPDDIETLLGWMTAIKENEADIDTIFPQTDPAEEAAKPTKGGELQDKVRKAREAQKQTKANGEDAERANAETPSAASPPEGPDAKSGEDDGGDPVTPGGAAPSDIVPDTLTAKTKVFVRMLGDKLITSTVKQMSDDDLNSAHDANEAALADPTLKDDEKAHRLGVKALLESEFEKRGK